MRRYLSATTLLTLCLFMVGCGGGEEKGITTGAPRLAKVQRAKEAMVGTQKLFANSSDDIVVVFRLDGDLGTFSSRDLIDAEIEAGESRNPLNAAIGNWGAGVVPKSAKSFTLHAKGLTPLKAELPEAISNNAKVGK